jgi:hypothetical protein
MTDQDQHMDIVQWAVLLIGALAAVAGLVLSIDEIVRLLEDETTLAGRILLAPIWLTILVALSYSISRSRGKWPWWRILAALGLVVAVLLPVTGLVYDRVHQASLDLRRVCASDARLRYSPGGDNFGAVHRRDLVEVKRKAAARDADWVFVYVRQLHVSGWVEEKYLCPADSDELIRQSAMHVDGFS